MPKKKPKTAFGVDVIAFKARTGLTIRQIADGAGVNPSTLQESTTGRCAGHDLIPKVYDYMKNYQVAEE